MAKEFNENKDFATLAERSNFLIEKAGVKKNHLALKLGISPQAMNSLCKTSTASKHTKKIAAILNANETWLENGTGAPFTSEECSLETGNNVAVKIPVFFLEQLLNINSQNELDKIKPSDYKFVTGSYNENCFGFYVRDELFSPKFEKGDLVIFEKTPFREDGSIGLILSKALQNIFIAFVFRREKSNSDIVGIIPNNTKEPLFIRKCDAFFGVYRGSIKKSTH